MAQFSLYVQMWHKTQFISFYFLKLKQHSSFFYRVTEYALISADRTVNPRPQSLKVSQ